jgi:hypothetical protein
MDEDPKSGNVWGWFVIGTAREVHQNIFGGLQLIALADVASYP